MTPVAVREADPYRVEARAVADALGTDLERGLSAGEAARWLADVDAGCSTRCATASEPIAAAEIE